MRLRVPAILLFGLLAACGRSEISGEIGPDGRCRAVIDGTSLQGPERGVRLVSRAVDPRDEQSRHVLVVYCRLTDAEEEPARIDFVKLNAPATGVLEPGTYAIDTDGDQPRSIGVVITAPEYLDGTRNWQPTSGSLEVSSSSATAIDASFQMEVRARGARRF